jgi:hypothetical protein
VDGDEDALAETILRQTGALVLPGYFYDVEPPYLGFSFALEPALLRDFLPGLIRSLRFEIRD